MSRDFPHLKDTAFPNAGNVNVYAYRNDYDFSRFDKTQMHVKLTNVPWDLGSVHVGLREIPMGNVVGWESEEVRDEWLNSRQGYEYDTHFRSYHDDDVMRVNLPYDVALSFNYVVIDYSPVPSAEFPVFGESSVPDITRWLYFVRDVKMLSTNTTELTLARDNWSMFINRVEFTHMVLERGHAPLAKAATPDEYLADPVNKNEYLLAPDVDFGVATQVKHQKATVLNDGDMLVVFVTTAYAPGNWTDNVPGFASCTQDGAPAFFAFGIEPGAYHDFMATAHAACPQFFETVQGLYVVPKKLVRTDSEAFTFCGVTCRRILENENVDMDALTLSKEQFGFDARYEGLTKLYTAPYSHIEVTDASGNISIINVQDCAGRLTLSATAQMVFPWVNISAVLNGIGTSSIDLVPFKNLGNHQFKIGGRWFDFQWTWDIPAFTIVQTNAENYGFSTKYDRATKANYADVAHKNTDATADANKASTDQMANVGPTNTGVANAANATNTARSNSAATVINSANYQKIVDDAGSDVNYTEGGVIADAEYAAMSAAINEGAAVANGVSGAAMGAAAGFAVGGPAGAVAGAVGSIAGAAINVATTAASSNAVITKSQMMADLATYTTERKRDHALTNMRTVQPEQNDAASDMTATSNAAALAQANNVANAQKACATRTQDMEKANATRNEDATTTDISNAIKQAALGAPLTFGTPSGGQNGTTRPMALFAAVVTEPRDAIAEAGAQFLRYGYNYNGVWDFTGFNVMSKFSYWKVSDIWANAMSLPDAWVDTIRNYLLMGVTVWRSPDYINRVSVFENERV